MWVMGEQFIEVLNLEPDAATMSILRNQTVPYLLGQERPGHG